MAAYSQIVQARRRKPELEFRIVKLFNYAYYTLDFPKSGYLRPVECVSEPNSSSSCRFRDDENAVSKKVEFLDNPNPSLNDSPVQSRDNG